MKFSIVVETDLPKLAGRRSRRQNRPRGVHDESAHHIDFGSAQDAAGFERLIHDVGEIKFERGQSEQIRLTGRQHPVNSRMSSQYSIRRRICHPSQMAPGMTTTKRSNQ